MGLTLEATSEPWSEHPRSRSDMTRAERRRTPRYPAVLGDIGWLEHPLQEFIEQFDEDVRYAAGLTELARWNPLKNQHYGPHDLEQLAHDLLHAQTMTTVSDQLTALRAAAELVADCRTKGWHLHVTVD